MSSVLAYSTLILSMGLLLLFDRWVWRLGFPMKLEHSRCLRFFIWWNLVSIALFGLGIIWFVIVDGLDPQIFGNEGQRTISGGLYLPLFAGHMVFCYLYGFYLEWFSERPKQLEKGS